MQKKIGRKFKDLSKCSKGDVSWLPADTVTADLKEWDAIVSCFTATLKPVKLSSLVGAIKKAVSMKTETEEIEKRILRVTERLESGKALLVQQKRVATDEQRAHAEDLEMLHQEREERGKVTAKEQKLVVCCA